MRSGPLPLVNAPDQNTLFRRNVFFLFHENRLLADDSHEISIIIPYFFRKLGKMFQNLSTAAIVIGALRVNASPLVLNPD